MGKKTKIEWCDHTHNPWIGCVKISEGCRNCYAAAMAERFYPGTWGPRSLRRPASATALSEPYKWDRAAKEAGKPALVFCGSMCDVFEDIDNDVVTEARQRLWETIECTTHLVWLLLTKRPEMIRETVPQRWLSTPPANVMYMTSIESQATANARLAQLLATPAVMRGLSVEPLLNNAQLYLAEGWQSRFQRTGKPPVRGSYLDWIIIGGESGPQARPCYLSDIGDVIFQAGSFGIPTFVKQIGRNPFISPKGQPYPVAHPKGADPAEWPREFRLRQFPASFRR